MTVEEWLGKDNKLGIDIWYRKYRDGDETFDEWLDRVSGGDLKVRQLIVEKKFLFGGRILANRGLNNFNRLRRRAEKHGVSINKCDNISPEYDEFKEKFTYSNCYVLSVDDSIESIFKCASDIARTFSYGGGVGIDISNLAPRGAKVRNAAKETTGAVSFMDLYSMITGLIGQNNRRGALMISLSCEHPDLKEFIGIKSDLNKVTKANISVRITDKFMEAVKNKQPFKLSFIRNETGETITKTVDAYSIFKKMCEMNWDYAEPGMLFWDRVESWNLLSCESEFNYCGVNPCAIVELWLK